MSNEVVAFKSWLDAYGRAWESRSPRLRCSRKTAPTESHHFSNPCVGEKPFSTIGQRWPEPKKTLNSGTRSWLRMLSSISPDGRHHLLLSHLGYKPSLMESS